MGGRCGSGPRAVELGRRSKRAAVTRARGPHAPAFRPPAPAKTGCGSGAPKGAASARRRGLPQSPPALPAPATPSPASTPRVPGPPPHHGRPPPGFQPGSVPGLHQARFRRGERGRGGAHASRPPTATNPPPPPLHSLAASTPASRRRPRSRVRGGGGAGARARGIGVHPGVRRGPRSRQMMCGQRSKPLNGGPPPAAVGAPPARPRRAHLPLPPPSSPARRHAGRHLCGRPHTGEQVSGRRRVVVGRGASGARACGRRAQRA